MRRLIFLTGTHRTPSINRLLGFLLAFVAGAMNAGGYMVVHMYTSHMTGFISTIADNLVLGNMALVLGAVGAILAFVCGAASTAIIVNWARGRKLGSGFALPLIVEALLLLLFGFLGSYTVQQSTPFAVPLTVLLLSYLMGLQNAVVSKVSSSQIRTTHMTGTLTDLGMELGKLIYWNHRDTPLPNQVRANRSRLRLFLMLGGMFLCGGVIGAAAFKHLGFIWVVPLSMALLSVSLPPLYWDLRRRRTHRPVSSKTAKS